MDAKKLMNRRKLKQWQKELDDLCSKTGKTLQDICDYLNVSYNRDIGFYVKIPRIRRTFIGIGMALDQPVDVINRWIVSYGDKRKLYSKDISEDLIWIYLINSNLAGRGSRNYFKEYDRCQQIAFDKYYEVWSNLISESKDTSDLDKELEDADGRVDSEAIKEFVINNIDSFKTAYVRPRRMLKKFCDCILEIRGKTSDRGKRDSLISLRGWLDDSMINFLSGSVDTVNVVDIRTGERLPDLKHIPRSRRAHIALALALGMTREEIDQYLELMGYLPLDTEDIDDKILISELDRWENDHQLQRLLKNKYIYGDMKIEIDEEEEQTAVIDMLTLRQELRDRYRNRGLQFNYMMI